MILAKWLDFSVLPLLCPTSQLYKLNELIFIKSLTLSVYSICFSSAILTEPTFCPSLSHQISSSLRAEVVFLPSFYHTGSSLGRGAASSLKSGGSGRAENVSLLSHRGCVCAPRLWMSCLSAPLCSGQGYEFGRSSRASGQWGCCREDIRAGATGS